MFAIEPIYKSTMNGNYVINIGRQLGSGGKEIGEKLAARLGIDLWGGVPITSCVNIPVVPIFSFLLRKRIV